MKRTLVLFFLLLQLSFNVYSQKEIDFKVKYNPETKYSQTIEQTMHTSLSYSGSKDVLKILEEKKVQNPTISNDESVMESVVKTGQLTDGTYLPITIEFINTTKSSGKKPIPDGTIIYGKCFLNNLPELDSIVSPGLDNEFKKVLLKSLQGLFSQIALPDKKLKIGEKFSMKSPITMPMGYYDRYDNHHSI
jgi:hypothetical protein